MLSSLQASMKRTVISLSFDPYLNGTKCAFIFILISFISFYFILIPIYSHTLLISSLTKPHENYTISYTPLPFSYFILLSFIFSFPISFNFIPYSSSFFLPPFPPLFPVPPPFLQSPFSLLLYTYSRIFPMSRFYLYNYRLVPVITNTAD